jgi:hypothetical protein
MRINWLNLTTVGSAAILVGTMIFGLAYATGWALGGFLGLGDIGAYFFRGRFSADRRGRNAGLPPFGH